MKTIFSYLNELSLKDLKRMQKSPKAWFIFEVSVFNAGSVTRVKCTDTFKQFNRNWNGYDCIIDNDKSTQCYIKATIEDKQNSIVGCV